MLVTMVLSLMAVCVVGTTVDPQGVAVQRLLGGIELPYFPPQMPFFPLFTWYGFSYVVGFVAGYYLLQVLRKRGLNPIGKEQMIELTFWLIVFIAISGRLGYFVLYPSEQATQQLKTGGWYDIMFGGGRSFHASVIGVLLACLFMSWKWKLSVLWLTDLVCLVGAPGLFFGRLGNFVNQELWGNKTDASLPWGMKFFTEAQELGQKTVGPVVEAALRASTQPAASSVGTAVIQMPKVTPEVWEDFTRIACRSLDSTIPEAGREVFKNQLSTLVGKYPALQSAVQQIWDLTLQHAQTLMPQVPYRHPSQLYNALGEGALLFIILWMLRHKLVEKKGFISGVFMVGYGIIRFCLEYFREPDRLTADRTPYRLLGILSLGQTYCLVMIVAGLALLLVAHYVGTLSVTDRKRLDWAKSDDEENPPAETYPPGQAPDKAKPLADKIAIYQKALDNKSFVNDDGTLGSTLKSKEINALKKVLPQLRALQTKWAAE